MAHINPIRKEIERICKCTFTTSYVEKNSSRKFPEGHMLELAPFSTPGIPFEEKLLALPHVIKLDYHTAPNFSILYIYFDCNPSKITL